MLGSPVIYEGSGVLICYNIEINDCNRSINISTIIVLVSLKDRNR